MGYEPRIYRFLHSENDLTHFTVMVGETDLDIAVRNDRYFDGLSHLVEDLVREERSLLMDYIKKDPAFLTTLSPHQHLPLAPVLAVEMCEATRAAGVGPMAAVAGAFSQLVGRMLSRYSRDVIVENGGDIWLKTGKIRRVAIFAGASPFSNKIGLEIHPKQTPMGICTSSGTVGHSLSFGKADAAVILSPSAVLADAVATATGNTIQNTSDLERAVDFALSIPGITGAVAIIGDKLAARGEVKLVPLG